MGALLNECPRYVPRRNRAPIVIEEPGCSYRKSRDRLSKAGSVPGHRRPPWSGRALRRVGFGENDVEANVSTCRSRRPRQSGWPGAIVGTLDHV